ncbi:uncharacterized protein LOC118187295 [Stegodyphus dumicola]|uniref:uncharacterized protein LOC118187295 n=1 Tax=Stegodyphus dumicola TaxID=202533 RepID=UPI0015A9A114|nr:uncharacterized protein LOC118187295 [Stegodyphus dumicola]
MSDERIDRKKAETLELTHGAYLDTITDDKEFETEFEITEDYREKAVRIQLKSERFLDNIKRNKGIRLTDTQGNPGPIEVLLGADVAGKLFTGKREELRTGLVAIETKLGWTLMGKVPQSEHQHNVNMTIVSMLSQEDLPISSLWDLELLGIRDPVEQKTKEESRRAIMVHFQETVRQLENGRYEVDMPWKIEHAVLPDNYDLSLKRLESTTKKLEKIGYRERYHEVFNEWLQEGVIERSSPKGVVFTRCSLPPTSSSH